MPRSNRVFNRQNPLVTANNHHEGDRHLYGGFADSSDLSITVLV